MRSSTSVLPDLIRLCARRLAGGSAPPTRSRAGHARPAFSPLADVDHHPFIDSVARAGVVLRREICSDQCARYWMGDAGGERGDRAALVGGIQRGRYAAPCAM